MLRLSPKHAEADHKPSFRHETERIRVESVFVAYEKFPDARFSDDANATLYNTAGLCVT